MLELVDELVAGTATSGGGGSAPAVIEELNVTPSISAQTITASGGTDGYSPVNVSAVTSSIDANIVASNIKDGVSILGVNGTLVGADTVTATNATGSSITAGDKVWLQKEKGSWKIKSFYSDEVNFVNHYVLITNKIASGFDANHYMYLKDTFSPGSSPWEVVFKFKPSSLHTGSLMTKMSGAPYYGFRLQLVNDGHMYYEVNDAQYSATPFEGSGSGSYVVNAWNWVKVEFTGSAYNAYLSTDGVNWTLDLTVTSSSPMYAHTAQTNIGYFPDGSPVCWLQGEMDLSECYINIGGYRFWSPFYETSSDNNWLTGVALENIASNATGDVGLGDFGRKYSATINNFLGDVDANGMMLAPVNFNLVFTGVKTVGWLNKDYNMNFTFYQNKQIGSVSFPDLTQMRYSFNNTFAYSSITSLEFGALTTIPSTTYNSLSNTCQGCSALTSVSFPELITVNSEVFSYFANNCPNLTTASFPKLQTVTNCTFAYSFSTNTNLEIIEFPSLVTVNRFLGTFNYCTKLSSVSFPELTTVTAIHGFDKTFEGDSALTSITFSKLSSIASAFNQTFKNCTSLASVSFPALKSTSFGGYNKLGTNMLSGVTGCTVHFPSNLQSVIGSWSDVVAGFGGTNTTVLFDLPATE